MPNTSTTDEGKKVQRGDVYREANLLVRFVPDRYGDDVPFLLWLVQAERNAARAERDAERAKVAELTALVDHHNGTGEHGAEHEHPNCSICAMGAQMKALKQERDAAFAKGRAEGIEAAAAKLERRLLHTPPFWKDEVQGCINAIRALLPSPAVGGKEDLGDGRWADVDPAALQKTPSND